MQENVVYKEMGGEKKGEKYHKPQFFNMSRKRFFSSNASNNVDVIPGSTM